MATEQLDRGNPDGPISFLPLDYEPKLDQEYSWGAQARTLWADKFADCESMAENAVLLHTGIGEAPSQEGMPKIKQYGDGSVIPPILDLQKELGHVPEMLFLTASPLHAEDVFNLRGIAREYKEQGVKKIVAILTCLAHERQDHVFDQNGKPINDVTSLKDSVQDLSLYIDGALLLQPHSLRPVELGIRYGIPILPVDAFKLMIDNIAFDRMQPGLVLGPDKGRKDDARMAASYLAWPLATAIKDRDRTPEGKGTPNIYIPQEVLDYIQKNNLIVYIFDDEIREAGTTGTLLRLLDGYAKAVYISAVKGIMANNSKDPARTAIDELDYYNVAQIVVTDAVKPLNDVTRIAPKLRVIKLMPHIQNLVEYLKRNIVFNGNVEWLRDRHEIGSPLRLDLSVEDIPLAA